MSTATSEPITIQSGSLRLSALLHLPRAAERPAPGVVVCHPHPRYGGDMYNGVVSGVARSLVANGFAALRFDFRGVGDSEGEFAWGSGETDDAEAALETLSLIERVDASRLGIAGYSFGAAVALQAAMGSPLVKAVMSIACPAAQMRAFSGLEMLPPKLFALGDHDHDFPEGQFRFLAKRYSAPRESEIISGADHFFRGHEATLGDLATRFFTEWLER